MAARTDPQSPAPQDVDSHDLIRVQGARENNLKDVRIEIPKHRLTVFTGVSGSGKSSLVFGTIAAESQRMINETYSAFVQGFMPTLARPEVDILEGLTTAIIVDQERMGANARSTVGTATDANALLRILFSRLPLHPHRRAPRGLRRHLTEASHRPRTGTAAGRPEEPRLSGAQRQVSFPRTSRSLRAKASGWPAYPNSPPRKPPWWLGNTTAC
jgi:ABC-type glutathione transport system ATPase component